MERDSIRWVVVLILGVLATFTMAACGADPTATPTATPVPSEPSTPTATPVPSEPSAPTATPVPGQPSTPAPTPTLAPGQTPLPPAPTPTAVPETGRDMEEYFRGKRISFWVGFSPGGGYDTFSRLISAHMPQYIPGNPSMVVRNKPGAGGLNGLVALTREEPDGYAIGYMHPRFVNQELISGDVRDFDLDMVKLIGAPSSLSRSAVSWVRADLATSLQEMIDSGRTYIFGGSSPGAVMWGPSTTIYERLGVPIRYVYGYGGSAESAAATDRGEVDMCWNPEVISYTLFPEWIEKRFCAPIFYLGIHPSEDASSDRVIRDMGWDYPPLLWDVIDVDPDLRSAAELGYKLFDSLSRTIVIPADTPDDITAALREAFRKTTEDDGFIAAANAAGLDVGYGDPIKLQESIDLARRLLEDPFLRDLAEATIAGD